MLAWEEEQRDLFCSEQGIIALVYLFNEEGMLLHLIRINILPINRGSNILIKEENESMKEQIEIKKRTL